MSETPAEEVNGTEDLQDKKSKKTAKHDGGVADLERVTDYAEEKELSSADISNVNSSQFFTILNLEMILANTICVPFLHLGYKYFR